jgi:hypothetical protein
MGLTDPFESRNWSFIFAINMYKRIIKIFYDIVLLICVIKKSSNTHVSRWTAVFLGKVTKAFK